MLWGCGVPKQKIANSSHARLWAVIGGEAVLLGIQTEQGQASCCFVLPELSGAAPPGRSICSRTIKLLLPLCAPTMHTGLSASAAELRIAAACCTPMHMAAQQAVFPSFRSRGVSSEAVACLRQGCWVRAAFSLRTSRSECAVACSLENLAAPPAKLVPLAG